MPKAHRLTRHSPRGARAAATIYSLIETCRLQDIDPFEYLQDLLRRIPTASEEELTLLIPAAWKDAHAPVESTPPLPSPV